MIYVLLGIISIIFIGGGIALRIYIRRKMSEYMQKNGTKKVPKMISVAIIGGFIVILTVLSILAANGII